MTRTVEIPQVFKCRPCPGVVCVTGSRLRFGSISQTPIPSEVFRWEFHCSVNCVLVERRKAGFRVSPAFLDKSLGCRFCFLICKMKLLVHKVIERCSGVAEEWTPCRKPAHGGCSGDASAKPCHPHCLSSVDC